MGSESLHEQVEDLSQATHDLHRAIVSLMEELEAIDWYQQRIEATPDAELKAVLAHNRDEEVEHAMMNLEWILRNDPTFAAAARLYLFSEGPIVEVEEKHKVEGGAIVPAEGAGPTAPEGSLGIGSLKLT